MKREAIDCDRCGKQNIPYTERVSVAIDYQVGYNCTEIRYTEVDLCLDCWAKEGELLLKDLSPEEGRKWIERVREIRK